MNDKDKKRRLLDCCCTLEDAIVVGAITNYPKVQEIRNALDYVMDLGNINTEELTLYQINKLDAVS